MSDLNFASVDDLTLAGVGPVMAAQVMLWRPYRSWHELQMIPGFEEEVADRLQAAGFGIIAPDETAWAKPSPFKLTATR